MNDRKKDLNNQWVLLFICWLLASLSTLGSLFFSEVMKYAPCVLCWYQRIFMYPLVIIFLRGMFPLEKTNLKYSLQFSLPLVFLGWMTSLYHNLLYYHILPESVAPCQQGISCTTVYIKWMGFITIPLLSLISFTTLLALLLIILSWEKKHKKLEKK